MQNESYFKTGSVWKSIAAMAIPSVLIIFVMILYNVADMFFIGCLGDTAQVAAVSIVGPVFSILAAFATMLGGGGSALIARAFGAQEHKKAKTYASICVWSAIVFGILVTASLLAFSGTLLSFLGTTSDMWQFAKTYLNVLALGAPFFILANMLAMLLRAEGAVKEGLIGNLLGTITNLVLDPVFIFGFGMGVGGAAVASVLGNVFATIYYIRFINKKAKILTCNYRYALKQPTIFFNIIALGLPNALGSVLSGFASTFSNQLLASYGTGAIAAMAAAGKCAMMIGMLQMALCMGCQPLLSYSYGAKDISRLKELLFKLSALTVSIGIATGALCYFGRSAIIGMFIKDLAVAQQGQNLVLYLVLGSPIVGLCYLATNYLQAANNAIGATFLSLLRQGILLIPLLYIFNSINGISGIASAYPIADWGTSFAAVFLFCIQYKKMKSKLAITD